MYDMFFREWWNEDYGASESRQHRDVFKHCILARRFTRQQDFAQKMLSDFLRSCYGPLKAGLPIWQVAAVVVMSNRESLILSPLRFPSEYVAVKKHCKKYKGPQGELSLAFEKFIVSQDAELKPHIWILDQEDGLMFEPNLNQTKRKQNYLVNDTVIHTFLHPILYWPETAKQWRRMEKE